MSDIGLSIVTSAFSGLIAAIGTGPFGTADLPEANIAEAFGPGRSAWVASIKDETLGDFVVASDHQSGMNFDDYPKNFLNAVLAAEDSRFQDHPGADPIGIASALADTLQGSPRGGSSLSQQLVKNALVGNDASVTRKIAELTIAMRIESEYSKIDIMEAYLRHAWFGRGANGAAHAARVWFGKDWADLSLAESATLAAMLKGPSRFDPEKKPDLVKTRRDLVIRKMLSYGWVDEDAATAAIAEEIKVVPAPVTPAGDAWILSALRRGAQDYAVRFPETQSFSLDSTISSAWQTIAREGAAAADLPQDAEIAVVVMRIPDGDLLATVGGVDEKVSGYDRTNARRQPGSLSKPLFYGAALDMGMTPWDLVRNDSINWGGSWNPKNYDGSQTNPAPLYQGLEASSNLMTVHLSTHVPMESMFRVAEMSGAWSLGEIQPYGPSLLGATETTLPRITQGLAGLANKGRTVPLRTFIEDAPAPAVFMSESSADAVLAMMRGVMVRGTASIAGNKFKVPVAGKTGTSQNHRDAWFVGMTPHIAIGVWVGRDDDKTLGAGQTGGVVSANVAAHVMNAALEAGLIDETGYVPGAFISTYGVWPPELITPERREFIVSSPAEVYVIDNTPRAARPGDEQVDAFIQQLNTQGW